MLTQLEAMLSALTAGDGGGARRRRRRRDAAAPVTGNEVRPVNGTSATNSPPK